MTKLSALTLAIFLSAFSSFAQAQAGDAPPCQLFDSPMPQMKGEFCVYPGGRNSDVLYYLHGKDENAHTWEGENFWSQQVRDYWMSHNMAPPTIVSVSLGEIWLLAPKTTAPIGMGMMDIFTQKIMPMIEARLGGIKGRRLLLGESMGGFNAIQLGMKTDLFAKVAALCAPMAENVDPFSTDAEMDAFVKNSSAFKSGKHTYDELLDSIKTIQMVVGVFWGNREEWQASNPIVLARAMKSPKKSPFYLAAGFFDHYMTMEGNAAFAKALAASGTKVDWRPQWGDHCAVDVPSLSEFLVK